MLTADQERIIVEACKTDSARFEIVYDEYYPLIFAYIMRRVGSYDVAKDLSSDTFLKAFASIGHFVWKGISLSSWLFRIATNEVNSYYRKKRRPYLDFFDIRTQFFAEYPDPASMDAEKQQIERHMAEHLIFVEVQRIIQQMPPKYQAVLSLRFFEGKSVPEIAEIVDVKEGTVKSLLSRGLERIRSSLKYTSSTLSI
jgi:RNA polymerase sigma-70 factor (ECF subfamily)